MIRVAVIMGKMHSGGKKNLVMEYYRHIDKNKVQFDFICDSDSNAIPKEEIESLGGRVFIVEPYQKIISNMIQTYKIIRDNNYCIVHGYNNTLNVFAMFVAKLAGAKVRINESISMAHRGDKKTYIKNILKPFSKLFSTHYMANGESCGEWQFGSKLYNEGKVLIFKTVIDSGKNTYDVVLRNKTRQEMNIEDNFVVGHIGRMTSQKNPLFVIDIFNEVLKKEPKARLLMVGDGELRNRVEERIHKYGIDSSVMCLGRTEDIYKLYNAMDCFLLPSLYEGLPLVGVEGQCCGLPIFFSEEIPKESSPCSDLGYFISLEEKPEFWADKIITETHKHMENRRSREKEICKSGFDSNVEAIKLERLYEKLVCE